MIAGIGVDLVEIARMDALWRRHGERAARRILAREEYAELFATKEPARLLAKRFAAKEALAKALGMGLRAPVSLSAIAVRHASSGRPFFAFAPELQHWVTQRRWQCHLSLADEATHAIAFVIVETNP
ncbi:MAG: holo-ACP synthase [Rhodocyclaceae bacterium]|nr:holo-ACP synthase [Rhodocyclaceae bacterium]